MTRRRGKLRAIGLREPRTFVARHVASGDLPQCVKHLCRDVFAHCVEATRLTPGIVARRGNGLPIHVPGPYEPGGTGTAPEGES